MQRAMLWLGPRAPRLEPQTPQRLTQSKRPTQHLWASVSSRATGLMHLKGFVWEEIKAFNKQQKPGSWRPEENPIKGVLSRGELMAPRTDRAVGGGACGKGQKGRRSHLLSDHWPPPPPWSEVNPQAQPPLLTSSAPPHTRDPSLPKRRPKNVNLRAGLRQAPGGCLWLSGHGPPSVWPPRPSGTPAPPPCPARFWRLWPSPRGHPPRLRLQTRSLLPAHGPLRAPARVHARMASTWPSAQPPSERPSCPTPRPQARAPAAPTSSPRRRAWG